MDLGGGECNFHLLHCILDLTITLNADRLNSPIKRDRVGEWIRKQYLYIRCLQETHFRLKETQTESKGMKNNNISWKWKEKKNWVAILIPDKIDFKTKAITRNTEGPSNFTSGYLFKETQNTESKRHLYPCVYCSIIYEPR